MTSVFCWFSNSTLLSSVWFHQLFTLHIIIFILLLNVYNNNITRWHAAVQFCSRLRTVLVAASSSDRTNLTMQCVVVLVVGGALNQRLIWFDLTWARFPFKRNRLRCVRCVKENCKPKISRNKHKRQPIGMLGRSSGNHDWLFANAIACVSCGFRLRNARNASDCV